MPNILVKLASAALFISGIVSIYNGHYVYGIALIGFGIWGFVFSLKKDQSDLIDSSQPIPPAHEIKQYRKQHPGTSIAQAIAALQKSES
ncbi:MAG: hypothetical protein Q4A31_04515 [Corynebacterium sp.]|uniref:hypothetical protein n=1 Tax=Corynebacterium sp. TaxID=1720 RepID=UPI0026DDC946|nr:hypothetical protein [Corynebacterium sp.]MDO4761159.1 hypothetical protein [Corynebacterium sp.]